MYDIFVREQQQRNPSPKLNSLTILLKGMEMKSPKRLYVIKTLNIGSIFLQYGMSFEFQSRPQFIPGNTKISV